MADPLLNRPMPGLSPQTTRAVLAAVIALALVIVMRAGWLSDDAMITVRCILNALHGYGPNFNIDERVQAYTHPLWFLCATLVTAATGNAWVALLALSLACLMLSLWLVAVPIGRAGPAGFATCLLLLSSKAFVDFSTSGLEAPLSNVLLLAVIASGSRRLALGRAGGITICLTCFGLLYLCRPDLVLLLAPFVCVVAVRTFASRRELAISLVAAAVPVLSWTAFTLIYYGMLVPNTALAKLAAGVVASERWWQGIVYLLDSLGRDAVTLPAIAIGIAVGLRRGLAGAALSAGMVLYLIFVVQIGGDFMSGRFLVAPFMVTAALLAQTRIASSRSAAVAACCAMLAMINLPATWLAPTHLPSEDVPLSGVADERAYFYHLFGLVHVTREMLAAPSHWPKHLASTSSVDIIPCGGLGYFGLSRGPAVHVVDQCALVDPLLSRLPAAPTPGWRTGHLIRTVPAGYRESLAGNADLLKDPALAKLYEKIRVVTRSPLFSRARLAAILSLNFGARL